MIDIYTLTLLIPLIAMSWALGNLMGHREGARVGMRLGRLFEKVKSQSLAEWLSIIQKHFEEEEAK